MYLVFLGVVLHMIGDTYAHRTIVPFCAVYNATHVSKNFDIHRRFNIFSFLSNNTPTEQLYRSWPYFYTAVQFQVVEFQSIVLFEKYSDTAPGDNCMVGYDVYDDDPTFCPERYTEAIKRCNSYVEDIGNYNLKKFRKYLNLEVDHLFPTHDEVKLNNFKQYCIASGYDTGKDTTFYGKWKDHSVFNIVDMRG